MRKTGCVAGCVGVALLLFAASSWAAEVGLVTAVSGAVTLQEEKSAASELKPFVKLRAGDRLTLRGNSRLQLVFFDGGLQEIWQGAGTLEVGGTSSRTLQGSLQSEVKAMPAILVKQLAKTPSPDGTVKTGMIRMRSMSSVGTLESVERNYADLRKESDVADDNPELYLLAAYLELREFARLEAVLKQLREKNPGDPQFVMLDALYSRAIGNADAARKDRDGH